MPHFDDSSAAAVVVVDDCDCGELGAFAPHMKQRLSAEALSKVQLGQCQSVAVDVAAVVDRGSRHCEQ